MFVGFSATNPWPKKSYSMQENSSILLCKHSELSVFHCDFCNWAFKFSGRDEMGFVRKFIICILHILTDSFPPIFAF